MYKFVVFKTQKFQNLWKFHKFQDLNTRISECIDLAFLWFGGGGEREMGKSSKIIRIFIAVLCKVLYRFFPNEFSSIVSKIEAGLSL